MRIAALRQNGDGLGSEKLLLFTDTHHNRFARLGAACRDPSGELAETDPDTCGVRRVAYCFDNHLRPSVNPLESITPHIGEAQLCSLDDRAHFVECREQGSEAIVIVNGIRFNEP